MKQGLTEIVTIHDETYKVEPHLKTALKAYNSFIKEQSALSGETRFSNVAFGKTERVIFQNLPAEKIHCGNGTYSPSGVSSVLDAAGKTINALGQRYTETPEDERPSKVILVIVCFGKDSGSKSFTYSDVHDMIEHQTIYYKWNVLMLTDDEEMAMKLGVAERNTIFLNVDDKKFFLKGFSALSERITEIRSDNA